MKNPVSHPWQSYSSAEEYNEDEVGEDGGDLNTEHADQDDINTDHEDQDDLNTEHEDQDDINTEHKD